MVEKVDTALINMWGRLVGAVAWNDSRQLATFEFDPDFLDEGLDLAPLKMPWAQARRSRARFNFPGLPFETFKGLPGLLADALPDNFGNSIIDAWLARQGRTAESFSPVERLCYTGRRAMGALEFEPAVTGPLNESVKVEVGELVVLARTMLANRASLQVNFDKDASDALLDIIRVGTSAGGGRPKAVIAVNDATKEVRSGQVEAPEGFDQWILKFDGVRDSQLGEPAGYGRIEFAYSKMATACGIEMMPCRLLEENDRAHFMTRRFDRLSNNRKLHLQSLCAVGHFDFNSPGTCSYEQAFQVMRELRLPYRAAEQQFRRTVFNIVARNQDDHTKNIAFLMNPDGQWSLSPAFDVTYAYNPDGDWTNRHQMTLNGKREGFTREDLLTVADEMSIKKARDIIGEVEEAVARWPEFASAAGVPEERAAAIGKTHRVF